MRPPQPTIREGDCATHYGTIDRQRAGQPAGRETVATAPIKLKCPLMRLERGCLVAGLERNDAEAFQRFGCLRLAQPGFEVFAGAGPIGGSQGIVAGPVGRQDADPTDCEPLPAGWLVAHTAIVMPRREA